MPNAASNISDFNPNSGYKSAIVSKKTLYSDLDLKFTRHPLKNDIVPLTDIDAVKNSVKNLIMTNFYERPFQPFLGSNLYSLLFENVTVFTAGKIKQQILRVLEEYEPRISNVIVQIFDKADVNSYYITIGFTVIGNTNNNEIEVNLFLERLR